jgi:integrase
MQRKAEPKKLTSEQAEQLRLLRNKGGRSRYQEGSVELVGSKKRGKKWRGNYYVYVTRDGIERRVHKTITLGNVRDHSKPDAKRMLREFLERTDTEIIVGAPAVVPTLTSQPAESPTNIIPSPNITLDEFWDKVFLPMYQPQWKESSHKEMIGNVRRYVLKQFGDWRLGDIRKQPVQMYINGLASSGFSQSVVEKARTWIIALMNEAEEQEFVLKNPLRRVALPKDIKEVKKTVVDLEEMRKAFLKIPVRERLTLRIALVLGLRAGEILALRRNDVVGQSLRIDEGARYGKLYTPKSKASAGFVWMPVEIAAEIRSYLDSKGREPEDALIFSGRRKQVYRTDNYRERFFNPALKAAGLKGVTMQICRRSCGTYMNSGGHGNPKDIQAHLRHAQVTTTMNVYVQPVSDSTRRAVESLDGALFGGWANAALIQ